MDNVIATMKNSEPCDSDVQPTLYKSCDCYSNMRVNYTVVFRDLAISNA